MGATEIISLIANGGAIVVFLAFLINGQLVRKGELDEMRAQRDEWRKTAEIHEKIALAIVEQGGAAKELFEAMKRVAVDAGKAQPP